MEVGQVRRGLNPYGQQEVEVWSGCPQGTMRMGHWGRHRMAGPQDADPPGLPGYMVLGIMAAPGASWPDHLVVTTPIWTQIPLICGGRRPICPLEDPVLQYLFAVFTAGPFCGPVYGRWPLRAAAHHGGDFKYRVRRLGPIFFPCAQRPKALQTRSKL